MKRMKQASLALSVVLFAGCSTFGNMSEPCVYNGVAADIGLLAVDLDDCKGVPCVGVMFAKPMAAIELPFSVVADTLVLPIQAVRYATADEKDKWRCKSVGSREFLGQ